MRTTARSTAMSRARRFHGAATRSWPTGATGWRSGPMPRWARSMASSCCSSGSTAESNSTVGTTCSTPAIALPRRGPTTIRPAGRSPIPARMFTRRRPPRFPSGSAAWPPVAAFSPPDRWFYLRSMARNRAARSANPAMVRTRSRRGCASVVKSRPSPTST